MEFITGSTNVQTQSQIRFTEGPKTLNKMYYILNCTSPVKDDKSHVTMIKMGRRGSKVEPKNKPRGSNSANQNSE